MLDSSTINSEVYIISKEQERTVKACHIDPTSQHMGAKKTVASAYIAKER